MDDMQNTPRDPWQRDSYETGSTHPPKRRGGLVAALLVAVIFLGGLSSALGVLNIKLFSQLQVSGEPNSSMSFYDSGTFETLNQTNPMPTDSAVKPPVTGNVTVELNKTPDSVENLPQQGGLSYQEIYSKNIDSVVSIACTMADGTSSGTGVILSAKGYIVTNCHVVSDAQKIQVRLTDDRVLTASLVGSDVISDLAVLFVEATDLIPAEFGNSNALRVGDAVAAIGDPLGVEFRGTMTDGIVSAINRDVTTNGRTMTLIQTNAALNSGNSGGPLINCYGQVIGINTMKIGAFTDSAGVEGLGFAIPSTTVKEVVDQLIRQGYVSGRPSLGFTGRALSSAEQRFWRLPAGMYITRVEQGSPADKLGIAAGDVLISLDGTRITGADDANSVLYAHKAGDVLDAIIYRSGKQYAVKLTLDEQNN